MFKGFCERCRHHGEDSINVRCLVCRIQDGKPTEYDQALKREDLLAQIDDVLANGLRTPCGKRRVEKECEECSEWQAPVRRDGYVSECYYVCKARRLLNKFRKILKEGSV